MKRAKATKPYWEMVGSELREATKEFEAECVAAKPLASSMKSRLVRAKRKRGRPQIGSGATSVLISIERNLLKKVDAYAKTQGLSRSPLVARSLRAEMKSVS